ncbi:hypothetical protein EON82_11670 [bacterium]|nr:MAG: hypothetical protein EON82_11670 [bacterium]
MTKSLNLFFIALTAQPSREVAIVELAFCPRAGERVEVPSAHQDHGTSLWQVDRVTHVDGGAVFLLCHPVQSVPADGEAEFHKLLGYEGARRLGGSSA